MTHQPHKFTASEKKLDEVVTAYLKALEAGEAVDQAEWLKRYPDLADELAEFFASQQSVERVAGPLRGMDEAPAPPKSNADTLTVLPSPSIHSRLEPESIAPVSSGDSVQVSLKIRYVGDYELLEEIARGGMGVVYRARQTKLKRLVAVKMILAGELANANDVDRFHTEARAAARLHHPNIVAIHEVGEHDGQHYFSMDFIAGESLANRIARGQIGRAHV